MGVNTLHRWCVLLAAALVLLNAPAYARTLAYVFVSDGTVLAIDTDTDGVVSRPLVSDLAVPAGGEQYLYLSPPDNLLLVARADAIDRYDGRGEWHIVAYDLSTLTRKKDLGLVSQDDPTVVLPRTGADFFVRWFDPKAADGHGAKRVTRFAKATLSPIADVSAPDLQACNRFSSDGARVYSMECDAALAVSVLDARDLGRLSTLQADALLASGRWGGGISDIRDDRVLLIENVKTQASAADQFTMFTATLPGGATSARIVTGMEGKGYLTPAGDKIVLMETTTVRGQGGGIAEVRSAGCLHLYDVATGGKLGQLTFPAWGREQFLGIRSQGDKGYLISRATSPSDMTITAFSLVPLIVIKQITVPSGEFFFVESTP